MRPALVLALAGTMLATTGAAVRAASDEPDVQTMKLRIEGGLYTSKALTVDSDGDGWTDWAERLNGTDPKDPASHPLASHVEVIGTTAYVQTHGFPDRLAVIDLALPEGTTATADLVTVVGGLAGLSPTGRLHEQLTQGLADLGAGRLAQILEAADKAHSRVDGGFGRRTNGMDLSLISMGPSDWETWKKLQEAASFVQHNDIGVGTTTDGDPYVTVTNSEGSQTHVFGPDKEVQSTLESTTTLDDGTTVVHWTTLVNGTVVAFGKKVTKADGTQEYWDYDGDGNPTGHGTAKTPGQTPAPGATAPAPTSTAGGATPAPSSTSEPKSDPTPSATSSGEYVNPDADPLLLPTADEVAARVAFLTGVRVRVVQNPPRTPDVPVLDEPGVADPEDPGCRDDRCVVFVEVSAPDLSNVTGGDPINPDHAPGLPGRP